MSQANQYIGRYAPSPSGPLHFGSLLAAVASYLDARSQHGRWLLRIEDLDTPRVVAGAADDIIKTLRDYGFEWDGQIIYQSERQDAYQTALNQLKQQQLIYPCNCSRKEIAEIAHAGIEGAVYPGTCRHGLQGEREALAFRIKTDNQQISFSDRIYGQISHHLQADIGDFILRRSDGLFAYQLAVVVDDAEQGITDIVRGADLLNSTTRQIYLQQCLNLPTPNYAHIPLVVNTDGEKLSKQTQAQPIHRKDAGQNLVKAFELLGFPIDGLSANDSLQSLWEWGIANWDIVKIPKNNYRI